MGETKKITFQFNISIFTNFQRPPPKILQFYKGHHKTKIETIPESKYSYEVKVYLF